MMLQHGLSIPMLLLSAGLAATGLQQGQGWMDRVVQFHKNKLFNEIKELAPINVNVELRQKWEGYEDSRHWDYESVLRLLTLIRQSEKARPVAKALRRMLQPTRRIMMSMKQSMQRFPSLMGDNLGYYDVDYSSGEENAIPPPDAVPEDEAVIIVSNPVEARLPSAQISVKLLREIMEARARAARQMPTTTEVVPWIEFVKNRTTTEATTNATESTTTEEPTEAPGGDQTTEAGEDGELTTATGDDGDGTTQTDDGDDGSITEGATTLETNTESSGSSDATAPDGTTLDPDASTSEPEPTTEETS